MKPIILCTNYKNVIKEGKPSSPKSVPSSGECRECLLLDTVPWICSPSRSGGAEGKLEPRSLMTPDSWATQQELKIKRKGRGGSRQDGSGSCHQAWVQIWEPRGGRRELTNPRHAPPHVIFKRKRHRGIEIWLVCSILFPPAVCARASSFKLNSVYSRPY